MNIFQSILFSGKRGYCWPLLFFLFCLISFTGQAQTEQKPQLETGPPANPTPTPNRPAPTPPPPPKPPVAAPAPDTIMPKTATPAIPKVEEPEEGKPSILTKMFVGGGFNLGFNSTSYYGTNYSIFNIGASPILGYRLNKIVAVGPGLVYNFYRINGINITEYGPKVFAQAIVYKNFLLHAEHVSLSAQRFDIDAKGQYISMGRYNVQSTLAGGGYRQMASDRFGIDLYVLFNLANTSGISSSAPVIRTGIIYNLTK